MLVGVLALQGAYAAHERPLAALGHETKYLRAAGGLRRHRRVGLAGRREQRAPRAPGALRARRVHLATAREGKPLLATCAGLILLAREVASPKQRSLGLLDVSVSRNAYGRQLDSFESEADEGGLPAVFIRAPRITGHGERGGGLATHHGEPIWVRQGCLNGVTFHPELTADLRVHRAAFGEVVDLEPPCCCGVSVRKIQRLA